jgi:uncharacterized membrane protein
VLVVLPLGFLGSAVALDAVTLASGSPALGVVTTWDIGAGLATGVVAAVFGLVDLLAVPAGARAFRAGVAHAVLGVVVLELFAASLALRVPAGASLPTTAAFLTALGGLALAVLSGWLGGALARRWR